MNATVGVGFHRAVRGLGLSVTPMTAREVTDVILGHRPPAPKLVLNHNLHSAYMFNTTAKFRELYSRAEIVLIDGWPVLRLIEALPTHARATDFRIGSTDWVAELWARTGGAHFNFAEPFRVFILGASPESNERAQSRFVEEMPGAVVNGRDGYYDDSETDQVLREIRAFAPNLVLVGMGMPRQEDFLIDNLDRLPNAYYATVGGAIDYIAGVQKLSPRAFGNLGIEWLWRLAHDPRRLAKRYCVEPFVLVSLLVSQRFRAKRSSRTKLGGQAI